MKKILFPFVLFLVHYSNAQTDNTISNVTFSGYAEVYYCYDFNQPENHERPSFFYSHSRHNEFNINLAFLKAAYSKDKMRGNFAIMAGTYPEYNLAAEQDLLKNIYEANAGIKLCKKKNIWLDAGIFASHIGFESAVSKDCSVLTRCILADNTPYYESGIKLGFTTDNNKWFLSGLVLNGWQRIKRADGNNTPAFGTQITFKPNDKITLNYSTFIGNDKPDSVKQMRYYHNFYGLFQATKKLNVTIGFDYGMEQKSKGSSEYNKVYSPVVILKYQFAEKFAIAARGEYYSDEKGVLIATGTKNGFQTSGFSLNIDYAPENNILFRIEGRTLDSMDKIFSKDNALVNTNSFVTASAAISF